MSKPHENVLALTRVQFKPPTLQSEIKTASRAPSKRTGLSLWRTSSCKERQAVNAPQPAHGDARTAPTLLCAKGKSYLLRGGQKRNPWSFHSRQHVLSTHLS